MDRLKRKPAALGLCLGGAVLMVSMFFAWLAVFDEAGNSTRVRPFSSFSGQTLFLLAFLAVMCGLGVLGSTGAGRIWWSLLGIVSGLIALIAAVGGMFDPTWLAPYFLTEDVLSDLGVSAGDSAQSAAQAAFTAGTLTAAIRSFIFVGAAGAALVVLGGLICLRKPAAQQG